MTSAKRLNVDESEGESLQEFSDVEWSRAAPAYTPDMINSKCSSRRVTVFSANNATAGNSKRVKTKEEPPKAAELKKTPSKKENRHSEIVEIVRQVREMLRRHPLVARTDVSVQTEISNLDNRESPQLRRFRELRFEDEDERGGRFLRR